MTQMKLESGWLTTARKVPSAHFNERPEEVSPWLLVIHNISLPPGKFGGPWIDQLFTGTLKPDDDPYFEGIAALKVAAHCLIRRDGEIVQYVAFDKRAWHAGQSSYHGQDNCNDFSIGIELEGTDTLAYTVQQYESLCRVTHLLMHCYPINADDITGHSDIAPGRKTDPGEAFDWQYYRQQLQAITGEKAGKK